MLKQDAPTEQASAVAVASRAISGAAESVMAAFSGKGTPLHGSTATATNGTSTASDRWQSAQSMNNWQMQQGKPVPMPTPGSSNKGYSVDLLVSMQSGVTLEWQDKPDPWSMHEALMNAGKCLAIAEQNRESGLVAGPHSSENRETARAAYDNAKVFTLQAIKYAPRENGLPLSNLELSVAQICIDLGEDGEAVQHALLCTSLRGGQPATVAEVFNDLIAYADLHRSTSFRNYLSTLPTYFVTNAKVIGNAEF